MTTGRQNQKVAVVDAAHDELFVGSKRQSVGTRRWNELSRGQSHGEDEIADDDHRAGSTVKPAPA
jgi:hypothetical protein